MERVPLRLVWCCVGEDAVIFEGERNDFANAMHGQRAVHRPEISRDTANASPLIGHRRKLLHIKIRVTAKIVITLADLRADCSDVDRDVYATSGGIRRYGDGP